MDFIFAVESRLAPPTQFSNWSWLRFGLRFHASVALPEPDWVDPIAGRGTDIGTLGECYLSGRVPSLQRVLRHFSLE
jgi:hypothetical protein